MSDAEPPNHGRRIAGPAHGGVATQAEGKGADPLGQSEDDGQFPGGLSQTPIDRLVSWRCNCHDNAVAESFFNLLKRERIRRRVYRSRNEARQDVFDYIEMFYNPKRKHVRNGMLSPRSTSRSIAHTAHSNFKCDTPMISLSAGILE